MSNTNDPVGTACARRSEGEHVSNNYAGRPVRALFGTFLTAYDSALHSDTVTIGWERCWRRCVEILVEHELPYGSGLNSLKFNSDKSGPCRLVLDFDWHHMNDVGYYTGWHAGVIVVTPTFESQQVAVNFADEDAEDADVIADYIAEGVDAAFADTVSDFTAKRLLDEVMETGRNAG